MEERSDADDDSESTTRLRSTAVDVTAAIDPTVISSNYKTRGRRSSPDGTGVLGHNTATNGVASGVEGVTDSLTDDAAGVTGKATNSTGQTIGVYGSVASPHGTGVRGQSAGSGSGIGVHGMTNAYGGTGVRGAATASGGPATGVVGNTDSEGYEYLDPFLGYLVRGFAVGVGGHASASGGVIGTAGVRGTNAADSGVAYGVWGSTSSNDDLAAGVFGSSSHVQAPALRSDGRLHVSTDVENAVATIASNFPAFIENTDTSDSHLVLGLKSGYPDVPTALHNFVQFIDGNDNAVGTIEGNGTDGVTYKTTSADYAESLPRRDPAEDIEDGDVVGIVADGVTRQTTGADRVLAVTDRPAVTGNGQDPADADRFETIAFTGRIPVRVRGRVESGDLVVPSGEEDGTGVAVAPADRESGTPIVGQAWESSDEPGVDTVTVAIGIDDPTVVAGDRRIANLECQNEELRSSLERKDERIEALEERVGRLETAVGTNRADVDSAADLPADD